jgi:hypothetical protein
MLQWNSSYSILDGNRLQRGEIIRRCDLFSMCFPQAQAGLLLSNLVNLREVYTKIGIPDLGHIIHSIG